MRIERDALGEIQIPEDVLWGINTQRAIENFELKDRPVNRRLVYGIVTVKKAAAVTYRNMGVKPEVYAAEYPMDITQNNDAFATSYEGKLGYDEVSWIVRENPPEKAKEQLEKIENRIF